MLMQCAAVDPDNIIKCLCQWDIRVSSTFIAWDKIVQQSAPSTDRSTKNLHVDLCVRYDYPWMRRDQVQAGALVAEAEKPKSFQYEALQDWPTCNYLVSLNFKTDRKRIVTVSNILQENYIQHVSNYTQLKQLN